MITDVNNVEQTVTTDANGDWTATVPAGDTVIDVDETTLEDGSVLTTAGSDPETVTVIADENTATTDDGYISDGVITGTVYNDENGNGIQDAGELGLPGVDVVITDVNNVEQTVTTDANGDWTATVPAGDTVIDVDETTLEDGSVLTTAGSDPETVLVTAGDTTATTDDGYNVPVNTGTLSGVVFNDENNNGIQDAGELGPVSYSHLTLPTNREV